MVSVEPKNRSIRDVGVCKLVTRYRRACALVDSTLAMCMRMWLLRLVLWANRLPQTSHTKGFSRVCVRACTFMLSLRLKDFPHTPQTNGRSLECVFMWRVRSALILNEAGHTWHLNGCTCWRARHWSEYWRRTWWCWERGGDVAQLSRATLPKWKSVSLKSSSYAVE